MKQIEFLNHRSKFGIVSAVLVIASIVLILTKGVDKGVDFAGGTQLTVHFADQSLQIGELRSRVNSFDNSASIVSSKSDHGAMFTVKIKNPIVEEGHEAEAARARINGLEKVFASFDNEGAQVLALLNQTSEEKIKQRLIHENPFGINDTDQVIDQTYGDAAAKIKASLAGASSLDEVAAKADTERAHALVGGLRLAFPAINRATPDFLNALLTRDDPMNRGDGATYADIAGMIKIARAASGDFFNDWETVFKGLSVREGEDLEVLKTFLKESFFLGSYRILSSGTFSPSIAAEMLGKAWGAIALAMLGILIYVTLRFSLGYAVSSIVALCHDVTIALGVFALFNFELSNPVVAAFLTIVGYSLNDTIVVFDRIRDNLKGSKAPKVDRVMNESINQTLSRTVVTSMTTLLVVGVIFLFSNNDALRNFSFPLLVGIVVGTYSSIFVASPVALLWHEKIKPITT